MPLQDPTRARRPQRRLPESIPNPLSFRARRRRARNLLFACSAPTHVETAASAVSGAKRRPRRSDTLARCAPRCLGPNPRPQPPSNGGKHGHRQRAALDARVEPYAEARCFAFPSSISLRSKANAFGLKDRALPLNVPVLNRNSIVLRWGLPAICCLASFMTS